MSIRKCIGSNLRENKICCFFYKYTTSLPYFPSYPLFIELSLIDKNKVNICVKKIGKKDFTSSLYIFFL